MKPSDYYNYLEGLATNCTLFSHTEQVPRFATYTQGTAGTPQTELALQDGPCLVAMPPSYNAIGSSADNQAIRLNMGFMVLKHCEFSAGSAESREIEDETFAAILTLLSRMRLDQEDNDALAGMELYNARILPATRMFDNATGYQVLIPVRSAGYLEMIYDENLWTA